MKRVLKLVMLIGGLGILNLGFAGPQYQFSSGQFSSCSDSDWEGCTGRGTRLSDNQMDHYSQFSGVWRDQYRQDHLYMPKQIKATGRRIFVFSPKVRQWGAYNSVGELIAWGRANGGSDYCADLNHPCKTPKGRYQVASRGSSDCKSSKFPVGEGGAAMPYCMFFHGGYAIHGSAYLSINNSSHGCIRVTTDAARWLSQNFMQVGTKVLVLSY